MNIQALISFGIAASIFLSVLTVGMGTSAADLRYVFGKPALLVKSVLAMSVLAPLVAILVSKMFSLHPAVIVALVTLAVAPVGALFSQSVVPLVTPGNSPYALGVFFASIVLSVILTPLAVALIQWIFGGDVRIAPAAVAKVVITSVLLPLGIGLAIGRWLPAARQMDPGHRAGELTAASRLPRTDHHRRVVTHGFGRNPRHAPGDRHHRARVARHRSLSWWTGRGHSNRARICDRLASSRRRYRRCEPHQPGAGAGRRSARRRCECAGRGALQDVAQATARSGCRNRGAKSTQRGSLKAANLRREGYLGFQRNSSSCSARGGQP